MPDNTDAFPQHRAGKPKPTVAEIVIDAVSTKMPPMAMLQKITELHPNVTQGEITAAIAAAKAETEKRQRELGGMKALMTVVKPIMREFGSDKELTTGQALKIAADRGDERAKAYLAHFESAEAKAWERDFKAAVELDPYWEMSADGRGATRKEGARHKTAEDLVAAYRANQLGSDAAD
jgi:response regulator RpfG family c-di-GMP phosphodiesterase